MSNDIDNFLQKRRITPPCTNLSARIIAAAAMKKDMPFWLVVLQEANSMFFIARPAYAVAFSLVLGIVLGLQGEIQQISQVDTSAQELFYFIDVEGDWTEGDWL